jgi:hypothetical protein
MTTALAILVLLAAGICCWAAIVSVLDDVGDDFDVHP